MGADRNQWQFPKNEADKVIGWRSNGKGLENKGPFATSEDLAGKQDADPNLDTLSSGTTTLGTTGLALLESETGEDATGELRFLQNGIGAVARPVDARLRDVVSITDFGAIGDGSPSNAATNAAAYAAAAAAAEANGAIGVYIPSGKFHSSAAFPMGMSNFQLFGDGVQSLLVQTTDADIVTVDASASALLYLNMHHFAVTTDGVSPTQAAGIRVLVDGTTPYGMRNSTLESIDFFDVNKGVAINKGALELWSGINQLDPNKFNNFRDLRCHPSTFIDYGLWWEGGANSGNTVVGCQLRGDVAGIKAGDGMADTSVGDFLIVGNKVNGGPGGYAVYIDGPTNPVAYNSKLTLRGNDFDGVGIAGAYYIKNMDGSDIGGNAGEFHGTTLINVRNSNTPNDGVGAVINRTSSSDVSLASTTTLTTISDLTLPIMPFDTIYFEYYIFYNSNSAADMVASVGRSGSNAAIRWSPTAGGRWNSADTWVAVSLLTHTSTINVSGNGSDTLLRISGRATNTSGVADDLIFQAAQNVSDVYNTKILANSSVTAVRTRNPINIGFT